MTEQVVAAPAAGDGAARRNVLVLAVAGALAGAVPPINVASGALAGNLLLGDDSVLPTLPVTMMIIGTAAGTVPAALVMRWIGRRAGFISGMGVGIAGALAETAAMVVGSFVLLCAGAFLIGFCNAFFQQFRFAAADAASDAFRPRAISLVLLGGIVAAVIGAQAVVFFADALPAAQFAGSYLASAGLLVLSAAILLFLDIPKPAAQRVSGGRPLAEIALKAEFLVAVGCAASAYALMSFMMTAAPLAMVLHDHTRHAAILGIQWHVIAMFAPSFFTGSLIGRFGAPKVVVTGLVLLIVCALVALSGTTVAHFWLALILLGVGWNFGFVGGTTLVTHAYRPEEKEKVQALNDFIVFGLVALASLSSGGVLQLAGWSVISMVVLPVAFVSLAALVWQTSRRIRAV